MKTSTLTVMLFLAGSIQAKHHHHHETVLAASEEEAQDMETLNAMSTNKLVAGLRSTLDAALAAEARDDKAAAVAKTAAIKNIQKALTARILKRLDDGQPLVEVARKMKAIEGMQPQINDMERRLGIMQSVEPVLENAIKTLQKVVDVRGMGKKLVQIMSEEENSESINIEEEGTPATVNSPAVKTDLASESMEKSKKDAVAKSVKDGEVAMSKAADAQEKAAATAVSNIGTADKAKETNRAAKKAAKKDTGACKTCEKIPLTKEEKKEEEAEKKLEKMEKEKADALEKEKDEEEKKKAEEDEDSDDDGDAKDEKKDDKKDDKKDAKKEEKKEEKKDEKKDAKGKDAKKEDAKDAKDEKKDEKKGKGKGKGKGGKKEEKKDDEAKEEKKEEKETKLDKDGKPICKAPPAKKDIQTEDSDSDSDDE